MTETAHYLADKRLVTHLDKVLELARRGNIPAARYVVDDVMSDLDDIQQVLDDLDREDPATDRLAKAAGEQS